MPKTFQGKPNITEQDPRALIHQADEARLLGLASNRGIKDEEIGTFYVILMSDYPYPSSDTEYQTFSVKELEDQIQHNTNWFFDPEHNRIIGTIPPTKSILEKLKDGNLQISGREVQAS